MYIGFAETPSNTPETTSLKDTKDSYSDWTNLDDIMKNALHDKKNHKRGIWYN
jgi:hypothetical protein